MKTGPRASGWIVWGGLAALLVLHLDFWRPQRAVLWFGWVPEDLLYRLGWMLLAWAYLMYICARAWTGGAARDEGGA